jgi:hypothetical protein
MIYLAISAKGLREVLAAIAGSGIAVWCGADAMTEREFDQLVGANISRFSYALENESDDVLAGAIETVREHHPGATIWIESKA